MNSGMKIKIWANSKQVGLNRVTDSGLNHSVGRLPLCTSTLATASSSGWLKIAPFVLNT
jgi:hypothetical protein